MKFFFSSNASLACLPCSHFVMAAFIFKFCYAVTFLQSSSASLLNGQTTMLNIGVIRLHRTGVHRSQDCLGVFSWKKTSCLLAV